jgi:hypothetical protein
VIAGYRGKGVAFTFTRPRTSAGTRGRRIPTTAIAAAACVAVDLNGDKRPISTYRIGNYEPEVV